MKVELHQHMIQTDGSLYDLGWYLSWSAGDPQAVLDGRFSSGELRAIADHMDKNTTEGR